jgi:hypothetical protein
MKYERIKDYEEARFRQATGVKKETFFAMVEVLKAEYKKVHSRHNGRKRKLSIEDMLLATLEYLYEYRTYECIAASYGLARPNIYKVIKWVEETLIKDGMFSLPGKRALARKDTNIEFIVVDTTETPIERPQKGQKQYYSGKKNDTP